ncbi:chromo domain-containing protein [Aspergillus californicus]
MPPPVADLSDDESTGESIPYDEVEDKKNGAEDLSDEEGEDEEDVYVVEKIVGHSFKSDGTLLFNVKWQGYDDPKDQTVEPEVNLDGAQDVLEEYFRALGGRPEKPQPKKRKSTGRPPKSTPKNQPEPKKRRKSGRRDTEAEAIEEKESVVPDWVPKSKSWENEVKMIHTIVREGEGLVVFLHWNNDKKSKVSIETCYEKCPRHMLKFYEQHLVFKDLESP